MKTIISIILLLASALPAGAQVTTTVSDTLYTPTGGLANGAITISNPVAFTSGAGIFVPANNVVTTTVTAGVLSVALVPNIGSNPSGSYYLANYNVTSGTYQEIWIIPQSATPVKLISIRAQVIPYLGLTAAFDQLNPPAGCVTGQFPRWLNPGWSCSQANIGAVSMDLENPTPADTGKFQWKPKNGMTLTRLSCSVDTGSVSVNLDVRTEAAPDSPGTLVLSAPLSCGPMTSSTTNINSPVVAGLSPVALVVSSTTGTPGVVRLHAEYILN